MRRKHLVGGRAPCGTKGPLRLALQGTFFIFNYIDRWIFIDERYETSEIFIHLAFAIHSSKPLVAEHIFFMVANFKSIAMPIISSGADVKH